MELRQYLVRCRSTITEFSKKIGYSRPQISCVSLGYRKASPRLAKHIEEATEGHVTEADLNDLYYEMNPHKAHEKIIAMEKALEEDKAKRRQTLSTIDHLKGLGHKGNIKRRIE